MDDRNKELTPPPEHAAAPPPEFTLPPELLPPDTALPAAAGALQAKAAKWKKLAYILVGGSALTASLLLGAPGAAAPDAVPDTGGTPAAYEEYAAGPLHYICLPWGSSCTIVTKLAGVLGVELSDVQAKLLLSAMMTDTLMLKSPTTTDVDRAVAAKLGEQVGVDPVKFGMEVFLTRPSGSFTAAEMVGNDIKMFEPAGKKLLIGQYETVDKTRALGMIDEIREAMRAYAAEKGADGIVLCITDIMEEGSQVLLEGETEAAQKGLGIADEHDGVWMPGVLSRKKQVAAPIMAAC